MCILFGVLSLSGFLFFLVDIVSASKRTRTAVVVDRVYRDSEVHVSSGIVQTGNGVQPVMATSYTPEAWKVIARVDGKVVSRDVDAETWANAKPGSSIRLTFWVGGITGAEY